MSTPEVFSLGTPPEVNVHALRRTHKGIQYMRQTGEFKSYMQKYLDDKKRPFIAWDGEGWNNDDGEHQYMLLQCSTGARIHSERLASIECLELILKEAGENRGSIHVGYGFGYDTAWILADMPRELQLQLKDNEEVFWAVQQTKSTHRNNYTFRYLPHKWLEITGFDWHSWRNVHVKIYDVMTFFQSTFINALKSRDIPVPEAITSGKAGRSDFKYSDIEEVSEYCQQELEKTVELMNVLRGEFDEAGIWVTQFHGPGAVASSVFKSNKIREHMGEYPSLEIEQTASKAYFGGHFEQFKAGHYDGPVWLADINSAYPYWISQLPSFKNAWWEKTSQYDPNALGMWLCSYDDELNNYIQPHPLPWRSKNGAVGFPAHNSGVWVWHPEAKYATTVHHGYVLHIEDETKPFAFVADMYKTRREWQAAGRGGERALKLAMNSLYGKAAQLVGGNENYGGRPPWHKMEWAGMITSSTRAQLLSAILQDPSCVIAVETDSIATTKPLELSTGTALGEWGVKQFDWMTYVQSGIYFTSDAVTSSKAKTRGIDVRQLEHPAVMKWLAGDQAEPMRVTTRQFIGLGNPRNTWAYGQWLDGVKDVKVAGQKRLHIPTDCAQCDQGYSLADCLHELKANSLYGVEESVGRPLPWLTGTKPTEDPELEYIGDAVAEWENARHS